MLIMITGITYKNHISFKVSPDSERKFSYTTSQIYFLYLSSILIRGLKFPHCLFVPMHGYKLRTNIRNHLFAHTQKASLLCRHCNWSDFPFMKISHFLLQSQISKFLESSVIELYSHRWNMCVPAQDRMHHHTTC